MKVVSTYKSVVVNDVKLNCTLIKTKVEYRIDIKILVIKAIL